MNTKIEFILIFEHSPKGRNCGLFVVIIIPTGSPDP